MFNYFCTSLLHSTEKESRGDAKVLRVTITFLKGTQIFYEEAQRFLVDLKSFVRERQYLYSLSLSQNILSSCRPAVLEKHFVQAFLASFTELIIKCLFVLHSRVTYEAKMPKPL